jgi:ATP-dependent DNA ligase
MNLPTLYKEKNGKTLFWKISTSHNSDGDPIYIVQHGYMGGKTQSTSTVVKEGKNKGRANETTSQEQCEAEAKSEWTKQKERKGYVEDLKADRGFVPVSPMLAHSSEEYPNKIVLPCYVQKKYDGICCLAHIDNKCNTRFFSRKAAEFFALDHLGAELRSMGLTNIVLHGELYSHKLSFQQILSAVKRDGANELTPDIEYVVYDSAISGTYENRLSVLSSLLKPEWHTKAKIKLATTWMANTRDQIDNYHDEFVKNSYEGAILRNPTGVYVQDKRSFDLLKYKKFKDDEFEIIGASENKGKLAGTCVFELKTKEGYTFESMPDGSQEERQYCTDWQSGKIKAGMMATVKYFRFTTGDKPVPFMTTLKAIRNYE